MNDYLQVSIPVTTDPQSEMLIAELSNMGFDSFQEEPTLLKAFITEAKFDEQGLKSIIDHYELSYSVESVQAKNWNEEWEKNFEPVVIGDYCTIRAKFHESNPKTRHEIVITPKMSFGTGHHATTYLMIELMQDMDFMNAEVLDFGTGTGILAIMAEQLGAKQILAIDIDDWSITNAKENIETNQCAKIQLLQAGNIPSNKSFKIILANLTRNVILESLPIMCKILEARGEILLSGLMMTDFEQVDKEATELGLHLQRKGEKSGWIALRYDSHS
jgi:ribosomal protein L11 methyltransferase